MANRGDDYGKGKDLYEILGLDRECSASELKIAYKKLALRWHPDRCSASGNSVFIEEAKIKFQAIQRAYSVLSDDNKRLLYDVGVYDSDDDDDDGMSDFLSEMALMMRQTKPSENVGESFEQLQDLFEEMFQAEVASSAPNHTAASSYSTSSSFFSLSECSSSEIPPKSHSSSAHAGNSSFETSKFCIGVDRHQQFKRGEGRRKPHISARKSDKSTSKSYF